MGIHIDAVAAEQGAVQVAVIASSVTLIDRDDHQPTLRCLNIFGGCKHNFVPNVTGNRHFDKDSGKMGEKDELCRQNRVH